MNDIHLVRLIEANAHGKPGKGPRQVLAFAVAGAFGHAAYLAGVAGDEWFDLTGVPCNWHVEPLPMIKRGNRAFDVRNLVMAAIADDTGAELKGESE